MVPPSTQHHRWLALTLLVGTAAACRRSPKPTAGCGEADVPLARATSMVAEGKLIRAVRTLESFAQMCPDRASAVWPLLATTLAELGDSESALRLVATIEAAGGASEQTKAAAHRARTAVAERNPLTPGAPIAPAAWELFERCQAEPSPMQRRELCMQAWRASHPFGLALAAAGHGAAEAGDNVLAQTLFDRAQFELEKQYGAKMSIALALRGDGARSGEWIGPRSMVYGTDTSAVNGYTGPFRGADSNWHLLHLDAFPFSVACNRGRFLGTVRDTGDVVLVPAYPFERSAFSVEIRDPRDCGVANRFSLPRDPFAHYGPHEDPWPQLYPIHGSALLAQVRQSATDKTLFLELVDIRTPESLIRIPLGHDSDNRNNVWPPLRISAAGNAFALSVGRSQPERLIFGQTGRPAQTASLESLPEGAYELSADGSRLARVTREGLLEVFDTHTGRRIARAPAARGSAPESLQCLTFSPDGRWIAISGKGQPTRWYRTESCRRAGQTDGTCPDGCCPVQFLQNSTELVTLDDQGVAWWHLTTGTQFGRRARPPYIPQESVPYLVEISHDGYHIAEVSTSQPSLRVFDLRTGAARSFSADNFRGVHFSPDDGRLTNGDTVIDAQTGRALWTTSSASDLADLALDPHQKGPIVARRSNDGSALRVESLMPDGPVLRRDLPLISEPSGPVSIRLAMDGSRVALWNDTSTQSIRVADLRTGDVRAIVDTPQSAFIDANGRPAVLDFRFNRTGTALVVTRRTDTGGVALQAYGTETMTPFGPEVLLPSHVHTPAISVGQTLRVALLWPGEASPGDQRSPLEIVNLHDGSILQLAPDAREETQDFSAIDVADNDDIIVGTITGRVGRASPSPASDYRWYASESTSVVRVLAGCGEIIWAIHADGALQVFSPKGGHVVGRIGIENIPNQLLCSRNAPVVLGVGATQHLVWNRQHTEVFASLFPMRHGYVLQTPSGETQTLGGVGNELVRCRVGPLTMPYEVCAESLGSSDLLGRLLSNHSGASR